MTKKTNPIPDFSGTKTFTTKLPILMSCRIRLNDDQRNTLKTAFYQLREANQPAEPARIGGSSVTTTTAYNSVQSVGLADLTLSDLITTRDSIPLVTIIKIQRLLKVEVITPSDILEASKGYIDWVFKEETEQ